MLLGFFLQVACELFLLKLHPYWLVFVVEFGDSMQFLGVLESSLGFGLVT